MTHDYVNKIFHGDWIEVAKEVPDQCVHMICTSPPYWGQRNYGVEGQLGLEKTPEEHIEKLVAGFREMRRILRDDGTLWVNYGDKYAGIGRSPRKESPGVGAKQAMDRVERDIVWQAGGGSNFTWRLPSGQQQGDLLGLAWRLAFALQADGWILRDDIVWVKAVSFCATYSGSTMPESVNGTRWERCRVKVSGGKRGVEAQRIGSTPERPQQDHDGKDFSPSSEWADCPGCAKCEPNGGYVLRRGSWRPTRAHEYVFQFTKTQGYFCDAEAVKEENSEAGAKRLAGKPVKLGGTKNSERAENPFSGVPMNEAVGRNLRDCWAINPQPWARAHYATFPEKLVEPIIKVSTSQKGVCPKCGAPWARVIDKPPNPSKEYNVGEDMTGGAPNMGGNRQTSKGLHRNNGNANAGESQTLGWRPTCTCAVQEPVPAVVYDPFMGSGTVAAVAARLGRNYCGSELNEDYLNEQATLRVAAAEHGIDIGELEAGQGALFT